MQRYKILWVDDEIDLLKPYVLTLKEKNFQINTFNNPYSILEYIDENNDFDLILLDENMPGKSGLTLIKDIKDRKPFVPIILVAIFPLSLPSTVVIFPFIFLYERLHVKKADLFFFVFIFFKINFIAFEKLPCLLANLAE